MTVGRRPFADLPPSERARRARMLRLEWACGGDRIAARAVARMLAEAERPAALPAEWRGEPFAILRVPLEPE